MIFNKILILISFLVPNSHSFTARKMKNFGFLLFDDVELLDFAGPLQVFSSLRYLYEDLNINTYTIGLKPQIAVAKCGMQVSIDKMIDENDNDNIPELDMFVIPGGMGTRALIKDDIALEKIGTIIKKSKKVASVCTGSLILAKLGLLKNLKATSHYGALDLLEEIEPTVIVDRSVRYHDHGDIIVSEGVSAGIDMSFHLVSKCFGEETSKSVRKYIEYYPEEYSKG